MKPVEVVVTSDFICPWCWISHRHLKDGIARAGLSADAVRVRFAPFELNPDMPEAGQDRQAYRTHKFGSWARSQAMDADVTLAGQRVGAPFNHDRVLVTPNTRRAHRLMFWAQLQGDAARLEALPEAIFFAYFSQGRDIGTVDVLVDIAASIGFDADATRAALTLGTGEPEVVAQELRAQRDGVRSVPLIRIAGQAISGAQPATVLAQALRVAVAASPAGAVT
jgi:predicted DsbA family dithiol-disulfide isomerase